MNVQQPTVALDHISAQYPDAAFFGYREAFIRHLLEALRVRLELGRTRRCLDVGCNNGHYTAMQAERGLEVIGLDFDEGMLSAARARHPGLVFMRGDAQAMTFPEESFDAVVSLGLLQCVPDWRSVLREICRVLKPGGVALVETNRAAPVLEAAIKCLVYALRGRLAPRPALRLLLAHWRSGSAFDNAGLRKFTPRDIMGVMADQAVREVVVHDPLKPGRGHDFICAFSIVKAHPGQRAPLVVKRCPACRGGIAGLP